MQRPLLSIGDGGMNFQDSFGRFHQKPVTEDKQFPGNNAFCYSGYAYVVGKLNLAKTEIYRCWKMCQTEFGYNRHPNGDLEPASSHDELVGIFMVFDKAMASWVHTYESQDWQVCNLPGFKPTKWYKLNTFKVIRDFWRLSREEKPRTATYKYPYIWPIVFRIRRHHIYFIKRCAGVRPSISETVSFVANTFFSMVVSIWTEKSKDVMLGFKFIKLKQLGLTTLEEVLLDEYRTCILFPSNVREYFSPFVEHPIVEACHIDTL
jgi:hypothetical protein